VTTRTHTVVYRDFIDDLGEFEELALHHGGATTEIDSFREKARAYL
jgi:hypothetical protein